eukprot:TRINITY_DN7669_c0_g1_i1.p1 TRINITY_DN7669_c0_g1~~TRINITY_DN7669_c0_g1_i1.p1  ORF type:complete len:450 (-),score=51.86 TRINITY_DN7669_c0_g1_i1:144-1493(-)
MRTSNRASAANLFDMAKADEAGQASVEIKKETKMVTLTKDATITTITTTKVTLAPPKDEHKPVTKPALIIQPSPSPETTKAPHPIIPRAKRLQSPRKTPESPHPPDRLVQQLTQMPEDLQKVPVSPRSHLQINSHSTMTSTSAPTSALMPMPAALEPAVTSAAVKPAVYAGPKERVLSYGVSSVQGSRASMEDRHYATLSLGLNEHIAYFGVYDGHAGEEAAEFLEGQLHDDIDDEMSTCDYPGEAIGIAFEKVDNEFLDECETMMWDSGSTVILALVDTKKQILYCVNLGDSRCVMCCNGQAVPLSIDQKPDIEPEKSRIINAGCFVENGRINGTHAVARAIGDASLKNECVDLDPPEMALTCIPEIHEKKIDPATDMFFILACDGLWDVVSNEEAVAFVCERFVGECGCGEDVLSDIATDLCEHALAKGSTDNVTVMIVTLPSSFAN